MTRLNPNSLLDIWHQTLTNDIEFLKNDPCPNVVQVHINKKKISFNAFKKNVIPARVVWLSPSYRYIIVNIDLPA